MESRWTVSFEMTHDPTFAWPLGSPDQWPWEGILAPVEESLAPDTVIDWGTFEVIEET